MSFVWRTGAQNAQPPTPLTDTQLLIVRILISLTLGLGLVTGGLSLMTFRFYGRRMDQAWARRIQAWNDQQNQTYPAVHIPPPEFHPGDLVRSILPLSMRRAHSESSSSSARDSQNSFNRSSYTFAPAPYPASHFPNTLNPDIVPIGPSHNSSPGQETVQPHY